MTGKTGKNDKKREIFSKIPVNTGCLNKTGAFAPVTFCYYFHSFFVGSAKKGGIIDKNDTIVKFAPRRLAGVFSRKLKSFERNGEFV